ncbi:MAG: type II secretion system protein GspD, partial [Planctomycetota bacterium]
RIGCWQYKSRGPRLGVYGATVNAEGELLANPELDAALTMLAQTLASVEELRQTLTAADLESKVVQLSYIDVPGAISVLKGLGIQTVDANGTIPPQIRFEDLPLVVEMPAPGPENTGLVGKGGIIQTGEMGSSVIPLSATELGANMVASPAARLVVMFHPARPEQFGRVQSLLEEIIDLPARQIYVEGMVIEITEAGLKQLGVEWELQDGEFTLLGGSINTNIRESIENLGQSLFLEGDSTRDLSSEWMLKIRALLIDGTAKVLSRPSVLALNNRQATIRIGEDIPIATSQEGISGDSSKISFDFRYIPTGILLNLRPRVSQDGSEISLMVDTIVSAPAPEQDLEIRDENGQLLASAPTVTTRRVQTYARIQNNTPFILGGLVSRNEISLYEKVPLLGDLPVFGALFRSESTRESRSEVIIVLTPYVLPEKLHLSRALPKSGEYFDDEESELHRRSCRIEREDIHEVAFLYRNKRFERYRALALEAIRENFRLAERDPFYWFAEGRLPGERALVNQFIYNALARLELGETVNKDKIFLLTHRDVGGYRADYLEEVLAGFGDGTDSASFFANRPDEALAISFYNLREATSAESLAGDPVPQLQVLPCPDRRAWARLLWELNQPDEDGRRRHTVVIHRPEDVLRLQRAIFVKYVLEVNGGGGPEASLLKFIPGRIIEIPEIKPERIHVVNAPVARYFFHSSEHFYAAALNRIESTLDRLDEELRRSELRHLLQAEQGTAPD